MINLVAKLFDQHSFDSVIHLAAESHVDRSIENPTKFLNKHPGTAVLLGAALNAWQDNFEGKLYHVALTKFTPLGDTGLFPETTPMTLVAPTAHQKPL